ncbi:hypothetical protein GCM10017779_49240 [Streptomyces capillispiralis]|uniref:Nucleopolyhedrovirus P10 family protein n=1 Tax=Streptomyces capillispiralis TaxID=68182 RepID=A0A561TMM6_9ACTN|nr:hypothetical protein FHX78_115430 [Streptomyces capillispiralis]GHH94467.1 hypothetical protein GCM10017779_49240 [Streptomyces capillispiralis]
MGLGRFLPLGEARDGAWIAERAVEAVLRGAAVRGVPGVRLGRLRIGPAGPEEADEPVVPPPPSALPPGPLRLTAEFAATAAQPLPVTASLLRTALAQAAAERIGLTVTEVDLRATELLEAGTEGAEPPGAPGAPPAGAEAPGAGAVGAGAPGARAVGAGAPGARAVGAGAPGARAVGAGAPGAGAGGEPSGARAAGGADAEDAEPPGAPAVGTGAPGAGLPDSRAAGAEPSAEAGTEPPSAQAPGPRAADTEPPDARAAGAGLPDARGVAAGEGADEAGAEFEESEVGRVAGVVLGVPGVSRLTGTLGRPVHLSERRGAYALPRRHAQVDLAVRADTRPLEVARAVRSAVAAALPDRPTVAVLVTALD